MLLPQTESVAGYVPGSLTPSVAIAPGLECSAAVGQGVRSSRGSRWRWRCCGVAAHRDGKNGDHLLRVAGFLGKAVTGQVPPLLAVALLAGVLPGSAGVALSRRVSTGALRGTRRF
jgi:hypothetical protein